MNKRILAMLAVFAFLTSFSIAPVYAADWVDNATDHMEEAGDDIADVMEDGSDDAKEAWEDAGDEVEDGLEDFGDSMEEASEETKEFFTKD